VSIQVGWSSREAAARETVAHELGHNFGRPHAPCGGPAAPDPGYPYLDAGIGTFGWDVFAVRDDPSRPANAVPPDTKDLMSYCRPIWISDYNYLRMIAGRQALTGGSVGTSGRALLVRGEMDGHGIRLDPLFEVDGPIPLATGHGVEIEVVDAAGAMLSRARVPAYTVEHGSTQSFVGLVPLPPSGARGLRVTTPGGLRLDRPLDEGDGGAIPVTVERGAGTARIRWDARAARHALVRDAATGEVLALIDGGLSTLPAAASRPLSISFSTGGARFYRPEPR
jgi:hypothetical protein